MAYGPVKCNSCEKTFDLEDHLLCPRCGHHKLTALDQNRQPIAPPTTKQISRDDVSALAAYLFGMGTTGADIGCTDRTKIREAAAMLRSLWDHIEELSGVAEGKLVAIGRGPLTPPDMETAMSDNPIKEVMQRELDELIEKNECYAACRAINPDNPVVVAEALPELVEAIAPFLRYSQIAIERFPKNDGWGLEIGTEFEARVKPEDFKHLVDAAAKLKARP